MVVQHFDSTANQEVPNLASDSQLGKDIYGKEFETSDSFQELTCGSEQLMVPGIALEATVDEFLEQYRQDPNGSLLRCVNLFVYVVSLAISQLCVRINQIVR